MIISYQREMSRKVKRDFYRLPETVQGTVVEYQKKGFWFEEIISQRKTHWLIKMSQYHFLTDETGKASKKGWVHESIYIVSNNGEPKLARTRSIDPEGREIYRCLIKL